MTYEKNYNMSYNFVLLIIFYFFDLQSIKLFFFKLNYNKNLVIIPYIKENL